MTLKLGSVPYFKNRTMSFLILHFFTGVKLFNSSRRFPVHPSFGGLRSPRPRWGTADAETKVPLCVCGWVGVRACESARARMCVYMLYIYVCVRARARMDVRESARARVCVCVCARADVCERGRVRVCVYVCVCACVRVDVCIYVMCM